MLRLRARLATRWCLHEHRSKLHAHLFFVLSQRFGQRFVTTRHGQNLKPQLQGVFSNFPVDLCHAPLGDAIAQVGLAIHKALQFDGQLLSIVHDQSVEDILSGWKVSVQAANTQTRCSSQMRHGECPEATL